jgi:hypothetical protein
MLLCFVKKLVGGNPDSPHTDMAALLFLNAAHVVSMDVRCVSAAASVYDLVISLVTGTDWVVPYSESPCNQTGFDQWRAYVRQDHLNQIDEEAFEGGAK